MRGRFLSCLEPAPHSAIDSQCWYGDILIENRNVTPTLSVFEAGYRQSVRADAPAEGWAKEMRWGAVLGTPGVRFGGEELGACGVVISSGTLSISVSGGTCSARTPGSAGGSL